MRVAVIGSGIAGLSAAWLLAQRHHVTLFEQAARAGGHSHTVDVRVGDGMVAVDTGFIVYNEQAYPNLCALFRQMAVETHATDMTFSVSMDEGRLEYNSGTLRGLLAQPSNLARPRFWSMLRDIVGFYRSAPALVAGAAGRDLTLGQLLDLGGYGSPFREDHLLPMAGAIWSAPAAAMADYPAAAFIRFFETHGLLRLTGRPLWRTVAGGSRSYVVRMLSQLRGDVRLGAAVRAVRREAGGVVVSATGCEPEVFDHVVIATHADQALALLEDADEAERRLLGAFGYSVNRTVLHSDPALMPRRRAAWASWNYVSGRRQRAADGHVSVTYWMNSLQPLGTDHPMFISLNPGSGPEPGLIHHEQVYEHPRFDRAALSAQRALWDLQGRRNTWFCGAYFGAGFHEDGLQAGLAVAEQAGGLRRPWQVENESGRICAGAAVVAGETALERAL